MSELPVIFTDLDGTLLDHDTYSAEEARSVLEKVTGKGIPVIPATSKTYSEVVEFRDSMNLKHAFIVENGAALYVPMDTDIRCPMGSKLFEHVLCLADGQPVGTGRILLDGHIGRLAVLQAHRKKGYGNKLLDHLELIAQENGLTEVFLNAQITAIPFYEKRGYMIISDIFDDAGIPHQTMRKTL